MSISQNSQSINQSFRNLNRSWQTTSEYWQDSEQRKFHHEYWQPIETTLSNFMTSLNDLENTIQKAKKEIK